GRGSCGDRFGRWPPQFDHVPLVVGVRAAGAAGGAVDLHGVAVVAGFGPVEGPVDVGDGPGVAGPAGAGDPEAAGGAAERGPGPGVEVLQVVDGFPPGHGDGLVFDAGGADGGGGQGGEPVEARGDDPD